MSRYTVMWVAGLLLVVLAVAAWLFVSPLLALFAIAMLLALVIFLMSTPRAREEEESVVVDDSGAGYPDHVYPVREVEGIGPVYGATLERNGIADTLQLVQADAGDVASLLSVGARTVRSWQKRADLMMVNGVGKQYAELLERSGVHSVEDLAVARPERLLADVRDKQSDVDVNIQGRKPSKRIVSSWIDSARSHQQRRRGET